jgi:hypothetical protein
MLSPPLSFVFAFFIHLLAQPVGGLGTGPTVWRFPDENAEALRAAVAGARLNGHLAATAEIETFLRSVKAPADLGCLADAGTCADADRAMLASLGVAGRMEATASTSPDGATTHVLLLFTPATPGAEERTFRGQGATLATAVSAALADLQGQATLTVDADPPDVTLLLDGRPLGTGRGPFYIPPGKHVVAAQKPGHVPGETSIDVGAGGRAEVRFKLPQTETRVRLEFSPPTPRSSSTTTRRSHRRPGSTRSRRANTSCASRRRATKPRSGWSNSNPARRPSSTSSCAASRARSTAA